MTLYTLDTGAVIAMELVTQVSGVLSESGYNPGITPDDYYFCITIMGIDSNIFVYCDSESDARKKRKIFVNKWENIDIDIVRM